MKKLFITILLSVMALQYALSQEEITHINVASEEWEGATHKDGSGFYFDLLRAVYEPLGIAVRPNVVPYSRSVKLVESYRADCWVASYLHEEEFPVYPKNHFDLDIVSVLFKSEKTPNWQGELSLEGKRVGWVRGYNYDEYFSVPVQKVEVNNRKSAMSMLKMDRVDFFADAEMEIQAAINRQEFDMTGFQLETLFRLKLYMAFANNKRGIKLAHLWDQQIEALQQSGALRTLYEKAGYTGYPF